MILSDQLQAVKRGHRVGLCGNQRAFKRWCKSSGQPGGLIFEPPLCLCLLWLRRLLSGCCEPAVCEM